MDLSVLLVPKTVSLTNNPKNAWLTLKSVQKLIFTHQSSISAFVLRTILSTLDRNVSPVIFQNIGTMTQTAANLALSINTIILTLKNANSVLPKFHYLKGINV